CAWRAITCSSRAPGRCANSATAPVTPCSRCRMRSTGFAARVPPYAAPPEGHSAAQAQHQLADVLAALHELVGEARLLQRKAGVHVRAHAAGGERRPDALAQGVTDCRLLGDGAWPHGRARQVQAAREDLAQVQLAAAALLKADEHQPSIVSQYAQIAR